MSTQSNLQHPLLLTSTVKSGLIKIALVSFVLLACASTTHADQYPGYYSLDPAVCTPPAPPQPGDPGYGAENQFPNGIYYDPSTGRWYYPEEMGMPGQPAPIIAIIQELITRPYWATSEPVNGLYYFNGGFSSTGNWYEPGYYFSYEIW